MNKDTERGDWGGCNHDSPDDGDPEPDHAQFMSEQATVATLFKIFKELAPNPQNVDFSDDCAQLSALNSCHSHPTLVTTDALCEGVHFDLVLDSYDQVGAQAAIVNLSDLASSGAVPRGLLWSLSVPSRIKIDHLRSLAEGFGRTAARYQIEVVGGNLCSREGPLEIHVTAFGSAWRTQIGRNGAQAGDRVYLTGTLGSRALGYMDPSRYWRAKRHEWRPHINEARILSEWGQVTAMMDISDGFLIDAERLGRASRVCLHINEELLPIDPDVREHPLGREAALRGGEDYILLFTAPSSSPPPEELGAILIGDCSSLDQEQVWLRLDGQAIECKGYTHLISGQEVEER